MHTCCYQYQLNCVCVRVFVSAENVRVLKGKTAEGDERAEKKPKSVEERLEHLESIKKYLPEAKYNQKIDEILKGV